MQRLFEPTLWKGIPMFKSNLMVVSAYRFAFSDNSMVTIRRLDRDGYRRYKVSEASLWRLQTLVDRAAFEGHLRLGLSPSSALGWAAWPTK